METTLFFNILIALIRDRRDIIRQKSGAMNNLIRESKLKTKTRSKKIARHNLTFTWIFLSYVISFFNDWDVTLTPPNPFFCFGNAHCHYDLKINSSFPLLGVYGKTQHFHARELKNIIIRNPSKSSVFWMWS